MSAILSWTGSWNDYLPISWENDDNVLMTDDRWWDIKMPKMLASECERGKILDGWSITLQTNVRPVNATEKGHFAQSSCSLSETKRKKLVNSPPFTCNTSQTNHRPPTVGDGYATKTQHTNDGNESEPKECSKTCKPMKVIYKWWTCGFSLTQEEKKNLTP